MEQLKQFWDCVKKEEAVLLATSAGSSVTMRTISPVYYQDAILVFTSPDSKKYQQLKDNPNCCFAIGGFFLEAKPEFLGSTMKDSHEGLRKAYAEKFQGAFDEGIEFGGRNAEFILFKPIRLKGWNFENGIPTGPFEHVF